MSMIERVARAIEDAEFGYSMNLTSLVDGVSTYTLTYSDGSPPLEFPDTDEAYAHIASKKAEARARAAIEAMREPTDEMMRAVAQSHGFSDASIYRPFIDAALKGEAE